LSATIKTKRRAKLIPPGRTYLFNLDTDPQELHNLAGKAAHVAVEARLRATLIRELDGREEGFVRDGPLAVLGRSTPTYKTGWECPGMEAVRHV